MTESEMDLPMPDPVGTIDHVFNVLNKYSHPFILVGILAHRWMGCAAGADQGFDLLIRDNQSIAIASDLVATGHWALFDPAPEVAEFRANPLMDDHARELLVKSCNDATISLEHTGTMHLQFFYLRLWSESTYKMKVDNANFIEAPELNPWNTNLVEQEWHPAISRTDGWWYGPTLLNHPEHYPKNIFSTIYPKAKGPSITTPLLIPKVVDYLDCLVYHRNNYQKSKPELAVLAGWQIGNLIRYLYLELPHQRYSLLFQLNEEAERFMDPYLVRYKRKPFYVVASLPSDSPRMILAKQEDPESYPENIKNEWRQQGRQWMGKEHSLA